MTERAAVAEDKPTFTFADSSLYTGTNGFAAQFMPTKAPTYSYSFDAAETVKFLIPDAPCRFHRWMQRVCLGIRWRKL